MTVADHLVVRDFDTMAKRLGAKLLRDAEIKHGAVFEVGYDLTTEYEPSGCSCCEGSETPVIEVDVYYHSYEANQKSIYSKSYHWVGDLLKDLLES